MRLAFSGDPAEQEAVASVYPLLAAATADRAETAIMALVARVREAGGPWRGARALLEGVRGGTGMPVRDALIDALDAAVATEDLAVAFAFFVEAGFDKGWLRESAELVARELHVRPSLSAELAELNVADALGARGLWTRARREGGDAADAQALDLASAAAAARGDDAVAFWLSCAARHVAPTAFVRLPPYRAPGESAPDLGAREGRSVHFQTSRWSAPERTLPEQGVRPPSARCRVCASPDTDTIYYRDDSGTGWRDVTHDTRCRDCGTFTTHEVDD